MKINKELQNYIETFIFPSYSKNDLGHNINHIMYVIDRSLKFASTIKDINYDMVYNIAAYHDIGHYIDALNHEKISAEILQNDSNLTKFFTTKQIKIMSEAVYDHRASMKNNPRSIYGKIVSSADRETRVDSQLQRMYEYRVEHNHIDPFEDIIEDTRLYIINKFGKKGYANTKMFFEDEDYKKFLQDISSLTENKDIFKKRFIKANGLNNKLKLTFFEIKRHNPKLPLDDIINLVCEKVKDEYCISHDELKQEVASNFEQTLKKTYRL